MKRPARHLIFWPLLTAFIGGSIWWILHVPRNPQALLRAIPGQAMLVSYHEKLASRWDQIHNHPLVMMMVGATGGDVDEWQALQDDPGFSYFLNLLGKHELALGYVPYLNFGQQGAWVFASWIGGESQRLRWTASSADIPGLESQGTVASWPVWTWTMETDAGAQKLTLALVEGMLVGTTAADPQAMHYVLDAYNGNFPSVARRPNLSKWNERLFTSVYPDRAWYKVQSGWDEPVYWFGACDLAGTNQVRGQIITAAPAPYGSLPADIDLRDLMALWGNKPIATTVFNSALVSEALGADTNMVTANMVMDVLRESGAGAVVAGLFGGPYSGTLKVINVPTLMVALPMRPGLQASTLVNLITDQWNARYRVGLVPVDAELDDRRVWRMEGTAGGLYGALSAGEQIAVTEAGSWIVIASNYDALAAVIRDAATGPSGELAWVQRMNDVAGQGAIGYLGFDLARGAEVIDMSIKAYAGKLAFEDFSGSKKTRRQLNEARAWLDTLARLNRLQIFASRVNDQLMIDVNTSP